MRVRVEMFGKKEADICEIHVDRRLTRETIRSWDSPKSREDFPIRESKPKYVGKIFRIKGIESVSINQHSVLVKKGSAFSWDDILPKALQAIKSVIDPKGKIVRLKDKAALKKRGGKLISGFEIHRDR